MAKTLAPHQHWYVMRQNGESRVLKASTIEALKLMRQGWEFGEQFFDDQETANRYSEQWTLTGIAPMKRSKRKALQPQLISSAPAEYSSSSSGGEVT
jgi:hypothetical protein